MKATAKYVKEREQLKAFVEAIVDPFDYADPSVCALSDWLSEQPVTPVEHDKLPNWLRLGWGKSEAGVVQKRYQVYAGLGISSSIVCDDLGISSSIVKHRIDCWMTASHNMAGRMGNGYRYFRLDHWGRTRMFGYDCFVTEPYLGARMMDGVNSLRPVAEAMFSLLAKTGSGEWNPHTTRLVLFPPYFWQDGGQ